MAIELPAEVRRKLAHLDEQGSRWLSELPNLIHDVERRWSITVGRAMSGGTAAFISRARTSAGTDAILKVMIPGEDYAGQVRTLTQAQGRGYVRLQAHDTDHRAMLLEALGPSMGELRLPPEETIAALCRTLRQAWAAPTETAQPENNKASQLAETVHRLWHKLNQPGPEIVATRALQFAERRSASDPAHNVVVHGDPTPTTHSVRPPLGSEPSLVSSSSTQTDSSPIRHTTSASSSATGAPNY